MVVSSQMGKEIRQEGGNPQPKEEPQTKPQGGEVQEKQKQEGKKRPVQVEVDKTYAMDGVKYAKYLLTFK